MLYMYFQPRISIPIDKNIMGRRVDYRYNQQHYSTNDVYSQREDEVYYLQQQSKAGVCMCFGKGGKHPNFDNLDTFGSDEYEDYIAI